MCVGEPLTVHQAVAALKLCVNQSYKNGKCCVPQPDVEPSITLSANDSKFLRNLVKRLGAVTLRFFHSSPPEKERKTLFTVHGCSIPNSSAVWFRPSQCLSPSLGDGPQPHICIFSGYRQKPLDLGAYFFKFFFFATSQGRKLLVVSF